MFEQYSNLDILLHADHARFRVLNIAKEQLRRIIPNHSHGENSYEIHYNAEGHGHVLIEDALHKLSPGCFYLVGPHVRHAQIPDEDRTQIDYCIYLQLTEPRDLTAAATPLPDFWIGTDEHGMNAILHALFEELRLRKPGCTLMIESLLKQIFIAVLRNCDKAPADYFPPATPEEARDFIIEEAFLYEYATLTLDRLAEKLGFGVRQTQRLLLTQYGKTFQQKRSEARMSAASILLVYSDHKIADIAAELGYVTAEHFTTSFRKHFGVAAREYRRIHAVSVSPKDNVLTPPDGLRSADVQKHFIR